MIGFGLIAVVAACVLCWQAGKREQATADSVAQYDAERDSSATRATAYALKLDSVKRSERDAQSRTDSAATLAIARKASAAKVRARLTLHADSDAVLHTDTGDVRFQLPPDVTHDLLAERASVDSEVSAMQRKSDALTAENVILVREVGLSDSVRSDLTANIVAANAEIGVLKHASRPHFTFAQGTAVGALAILAGRVALALITHR